MKPKTKTHTFWHSINSENVKLIFGATLNSECVKICQKFTITTKIK